MPTRGKHRVPMGRSSCVRVRCHCIPGMPTRRGEGRDAIRRECHRLVLYRRIHRHPPQLPGHHRAGPKTRLDRRLQDLLAAGCPDAPAILRQTARVNGRAVLEILLPEKVLPVGILHPARHHSLFRQIVHMLEIFQLHHQTDGIAGAVQRTEGLVECSQSMIPASRNSSWR